MDKTISKPYSIPGSLVEQVHRTAYDFGAAGINTSDSHIVATCIKLALPMIKANPLLLKFSEFQAVMQYQSAISKTANITSIKKVRRA